MVLFNFGIGYMEVIISMVDDRLLGYLVLKCVKAVSGKRGKNIVVKILKGSPGGQTSDVVEQFGIQMLYGVIRHCTDDKIIEVINRLLNKDFIQVRQINFGLHSYPMITITEAGLHLMEALETTEEAKIKELISYSERVNALPAVKGPEFEKLDRLLSSAFKILSYLHSHMDKTDNPEGIAAAINMPVEAIEDCGDFFQKYLLPPNMGMWFGKDGFTRINDTFMDNIRAYLGGIPEKQAAVFRLAYNMQDEFYHDKECIMRYYKMDIQMMQELLVSAIGKVFTRKQQRRNWMIAAIAKHILSLVPNPTVPLSEKDTDA